MFIKKITKDDKYYTGYFDKELNAWIGGDNDNTPHTAYRLFGRILKIRNYGNAFIFDEGGTKVIESLYYRTTLFRIAFYFHSLIRFFVIFAIYLKPRFHFEFKLKRLRKPSFYRVR